MLDSIYQETLSRMAKLSDRVRFVVPDRVVGMSGGHFSSRALGSSVDFYDHRVYQPGDDPRHLNWNAYARTDVPMMKTFVEEVVPRVDLILDLSPSMFSPDSKLIRMFEWIGFIANSFLKQGVKVKCFDLFGALPAGPMEFFEPTLRGESTVERGLGTKLLPLRPHSIRICLSDLLFDEAPQRLIQMLRYQAGAVLILCPYLESEVHPAWDGNYRFIDSESREAEERRITPEVLKIYREAYERHFNAWLEQSSISTIDLWRIPAEGDFLSLLQSHPMAQRWIQQA